MGISGRPRRAGSEITRTLSRVPTRPTGQAPRGARGERALAPARRGPSIAGMGLLTRTRPPPPGGADDEVAFTGEFLVPGRTPTRIEADHRARYAFAGAHVRGLRVLDAACGTGYGTRMLRDAGAAHVTGMDVGDAQIAYARRHFGGAGVDFVRGDVTCDGPTGAYDVVVSFETIEHVPDYAAALRTMRRVLVPGGLLVVSSPNRHVTSPRARGLGSRPRNPFHAQEFTPAELIAALRAAGFVPREPVYGQRRRPVLPAAARPLYRVAPVAELLASPRPRPLRRGWTGRYVVVVARRDLGPA